MGSTPYGLQSMLKEGHTHLTGLEEAVVKNIEACKGLSKITRTSLGPNGMNKMVINHLDKLFVTSDAATIVNELEVQHPAAKLLVLAAKAQETEIGDGTNLVVSLGGELLAQAEELLRDGLHPSDIIAGYLKAGDHALELLESFATAGSDQIDVRDPAAVSLRIKGSTASKQYGYEDLLTPLISKACIDVCPKNSNNFNVDNVRVAKLLGGGLSQSEVVQGYLLRRGTEGSVQSVKNAKVAVYGCAVDTAGTETKGTVLIRSAEELQEYSKGEEAMVEKNIMAIRDAGVKVIVCGQSIGEMALHFIERYGMMAIKIPSKFELRRMCRATNAVALVKLEPPSQEDLGYASSISVDEIGGTKVTVVRQDDATSKISTVVLRGSTENVMDDIERAVDDGVNAYKAICKDARTLAAGGATEIALASRLAAFARKETGLEQYAIAKFSKALEVVPRTLAENAGLNATDTVAAVYAAQAKGDLGAGVNIEDGGVKDLSAEGIYDLYLTKYWAIKLAVDAVTTVLRIDQVIMAKQAGGPKAPAGGGDED